MELDILYMSFSGIHYWAWFGTMYLILLTWQDHKNNMMVDDRKNYFMMGITISLVSHVPQPFWYVLCLLVVVIGLGFFLKRMNVVGEADIKTISWIFFGLGLINVFKLAFFSIVFCLVSVLYVLIKKFVLRTEKKTPFYIVILIVFGISCWFMGLY